MIIWKPIRQASDLYEVSNLGEVRNIKSGRILKVWKGRKLNDYRVKGYVNPKVITMHINVLLRKYFTNADYQAFKERNPDIRKLKQTNKEINEIKNRIQSEYRKYDGVLDWAKIAAIKIHRAYER